MPVVLQAPDECARFIRAIEQLGCKADPPEQRIARAGRVAVIEGGTAEGVEAEYRAPGAQEERQTRAVDRAVAEVQGADRIGEALWNTRVYRLALRCSVVTAQVFAFHSRGIVEWPLNAGGVGVPFDLFRVTAGELSGQVEARFVALAGDQVDHTAD